MQISALKIILFFNLFTIAPASAADLCTLFYRNVVLVSFKKVTQRYQTKTTLMRIDQPLEVNLPKGFNSDLSIEVFGDPQVKYFISRVESSNGEKLVYDEKTGQNLKSQISPDDFGIIKIGFDKDALAAFNSPLRNFPEYEGGIETLVIPSHLLNFSNNQTLSIYVIAEGNREVKPISVVLHTRKKLSSKAKKKLPLNFFIPKGMDLPADSLLITSLLNHLNTVYSSTGIEFNLGHWKEVRSEFLDLQLENNASSIFSKISADAPYGLNVLFSKELYMSEAGYVAGYSPNLPGPASPVGVKKSGVLLRIQHFPEITDSDLVRYWTSEFGNYLAHEVGHYLGLSHTYETIAETAIDNISDTPLTESNNLMDPSARRGEPLYVTPGQSRELSAHPLVQ